MAGFEEEAVPVCRARVVKHSEAGRLFPVDAVMLEAENGAAYIWPLSAVGFRAGDLVEIRLLERPRAAK